MKYLIYCLLAIVFIACQGINKKEILGYEIIGQIKEAPDSLLVIISNEHFRDSTILLNGKFKFIGSADIPRKVLLSIEKAEGRAIFWLENARITIDGVYTKLNSAEVSGGENQRILNVRLNRTTPDLNAMNNYANQLQSKLLNKSQKDSILNKYEILSTKHEYNEQQFVLDYPNTLESVILLKIKRTKWSKETVSKIFSKMNKDIQSTKEGVIISEYLQLRINPQVGEKFIDYSLENSEGKIVRLSQFIGTYTLIDFWASWCAPCRKENPNLVTFYDKYKGSGFQIIGATMDREKSDWIEAIKQDKLPWENVIDKVGLESNNIFMLYNVNFIPDNLLIDKDGIIVARNLSGDEIRDKLELYYGF